MYDHTLHHRQKQFCPYCLQAFSTAEILKSHVVALKLMVNKQLTYLEKVNMLDS